MSVVVTIAILKEYANSKACHTFKTPDAPIFRASAPI